jgi:hypothetical protein
MPELGCRSGFIVAARATLKKWARWPGWLLQLDHRGRQQKTQSRCYPRRIFGVRRLIS